MYRAFSIQNFNADTVGWPIWLSRITNVSHFLLTVASSTNFIIYFAKHGRLQSKWFDSYCCCCNKEIQKETVGDHVSFPENSCEVKLFKREIIELIRNITLLSITDINLSYLFILCSEWK